MEAEGILTGFHASVDPIQLGYHIKAYISLEISPAQKPEVYPFLRAHPNVLECDCVTGNYSVLLKVAFPSTMELDEFIGKLQHFGKTSEYSYAAEPPVQFRLSHLSRRSEPL